MYGMRPVKFKVGWFLAKLVFGGIEFGILRSLSIRSLNAALLQAAVFQAPQVSYSIMLGVIFMLGVIKLNK